MPTTRRTYGFGPLSVEVTTTRRSRSEERSNSSSTRRSRSTNGRSTRYDHPHSTAATTYSILPPTHLSGLPQAPISPAFYGPAPGTTGLLGWPPQIPSADNGYPHDYFVHDPATIVFAEPPQEFNGYGVGAEPSQASIYPSQASVYTVPPTTTSFPGQVPATHYTGAYNNSVVSIRPYPAPVQSTVPVSVVGTGPYQVPVDWPVPTVDDGAQRHGNVLRCYETHDGRRFQYTIKRFRQGQNGRDTNMLYVMTRVEVGGHGGPAVVVVRQSPLPNSRREESLKDLVQVVNRKATLLLRSRENRGGGVREDGLRWWSQLV